MEDKNLNTKKIVSSASDKGAIGPNAGPESESGTEFQNQDKPLGINTAVIGGIAGTALVVGGAIYLSANDGEKGQELYSYVFGDDKRTIETPTTEAPEKLYDSGGEVVYTHSPGSEQNLSSFGLAFKSAREAGLPQFDWEGKPYHTKLKEEVIDFIPSRSVSQQEFAGLEQRVDAVEIKLEEFPTPIEVNTIEGETRVASEVIEKPETDEFGVVVDDSESTTTQNIYGSLDTNNDGKIDMVVVDKNSDGMVDAIQVDENFDGKFEIFMSNDNNDASVDSMIQDVDGNGIDQNDVVEPVNFEFNMSDYQLLDETDPAAGELDVLDNLL